jgi:hypothetical protein
MQTFDERCVNERSSDYCQHASAVSIEAWEQTARCHVDVNGQGIKRESNLWYTQMDGNRGLTFSSSATARSVAGDVVDTLALQATPQSAGRNERRSYSNTTPSAGALLLYCYKSACTCRFDYSVYLLCWYKSTNTDA